nr:MAG TPA: hypothetical protein [Caudoviricetes sp.]
MNYSFIDCFCYIFSSTLFSHMFLSSILSRVQPSEQIALKCR